MKTPTVMKILSVLKHDPKRHDFFHIGADGVLRIYQSDTYEIIDAARLSTAQIKQYLDRSPFNQAREDKFRGVDGRGVSDKDLFNPPEDIRPKRPTEEQLEEHRRVVAEQMAEQHRKGVKVDNDTVTTP